MVCCMVKEQLNRSQGQEQTGKNSGEKSDVESVTTIYERAVKDQTQQARRSETLQNSSSSEEEQFDTSDESNFEIVSKPNQLSVPHNFIAGNPIQLDGQIPSTSMGVTGNATSGGVQQQ